VLYLAAIIGLSILWGRAAKISLWQLVLACSISLFVAPHLYFHDLSFLLLPLLITALIIAERIRPGQSRAVLVALLLVCSLTLLFGDIWDPIRFVFPYLIMLALPLLSWFYTTRPPAQEIPTQQME